MLMPYLNYLSYVKYVHYKWYQPIFSSRAVMARAVMALYIIDKLTFSPRMQTAAVGKDRSFS